MNTLTAERLREILDYDPETGVFIWKHGARCSWAGKTAGSLNGDGRIQIKVDGKLYLSHRLAWLYMTGKWPKDQIDHKAGDPTNNRWKNLRQADNQINCENKRKAQKNNACGILGITRIARLKIKPWRAQIQTNGKGKFLGYFATPEEAHETYLRLKRELHKGCTI